jgi:membrane protease YdiL (CAAX protease family)
MTGAGAADTSYLALAARGKNSWARYIGAPILALALAAIVGIVCVIAAMMLGLLSPDGALDTTDPMVFFGLVGASDAPMLAAFIVAIRVIHKKRFTDIVGAWRWRDFALGAVLWAGVAIALAAVDFAIAPADFSINDAAAPLPLIAVIIAAVAVQTFFEEFIFRGYINQGLFLATKSESVTALLSGSIFGAMHIPNGWPQAIAATVMGVGFAFIAMRNAGIAWPSGMHFANNCLGALLIVSANDVFSASPGLFIQNSPQLIWFDTATVMIAIVAVSFALTRRRQGA